MLYTNEKEQLIKNYNEEIRRLKEEIEREKKEFIEQKEKEGWVKFRYVSKYFDRRYGYTGSDIVDIYLFHPSVDFSQWIGVKFLYGYDSDETTKNFVEWCEKIGDDKYIIVPTE